MALIQCDLFSHSLMRTVTVQVLLPTDKMAPGAAPKGPFKTLYLLHGIFGNRTDWVCGTRLQSWAADRNLAVVMPSGENSFYVDNEKASALYGTFTLIVLTSVVKHFPFASKSGTANMLSISVELEEAADIAGASFWKRMVSIIVPLAKNGFISGFMLTFISIAKELDLIIIMMTPTTRTMSYLAFTYSQDGYNQMADAISVIVLLFILVCYIIANKFGADIGKSWG